MPYPEQPVNLQRVADGKTVPRIGLCLSGGGFRASFFGLGAVRYLAEAGLLEAVEAVSAVSGGSLTAAVLADHWPALRSRGFAPEAVTELVAAPFAKCVSRHNLRNRGVGRWLVTRPLPGHRFGSARGQVLAKQLLSAQKLGDLPPDLQVVLTSTDLASGRAFRVSQAFLGSWDFSYTKTPKDLPLSTALAASTAVPVIFPPVRIATEGLGLAGAPAQLSLVDGGVYDNLGLEWFQGWDRGRPPEARECDYIIVLDSSSPLVLDPRRDFSWRRSVFRSQAAQYNQSRMSRIRWFVAQLLDGHMAGIYAPIGADPRSYRAPDGSEADAATVRSSLPRGFGEKLSLLRTDLDRFSPDETSLLMYHGYWSLHCRLSVLRPELAVEQPRWTEFGSLNTAETAALVQMLEAGRGRKPFRR